MTVDTAEYCIHTVLAVPKGWRAVGAAAAKSLDARFGEAGGALYGAWRSQIGRPRDEVNLISRWPDGAPDDVSAILTSALPPFRSIESRSMRPTVRPFDGAPPRRQGNFAFRWFTLDEARFEEFLELCVGAWPGFESAYDSQIIGLWRLESDRAGMADALLLTRRPDLAMWERSKLPANPAEAEVRRKLSRRYDLCDDTHVFTTTLLTAGDRVDEARWT